MFKNKEITLEFFVVGIAFACALGLYFGVLDGEGAGQVKSIVVTSSDFLTNTRMSDKHAWKIGNSSPQLAWNNLPLGTQSIAVICDDPDAPKETPWVHWVMFNIPASETGLAAGIGKDVKFANGACQGTTDFKQVGFDGPWPPEGHGDHHYHFKIYALDAMIALPAGSTTKQQLENAMRDHILAMGELVGIFSR